MKYALISDIHSNLPALEAVLEDIDSQDDVDAVYHLGDLVGYAPWPNEVVALIRERGIPGIAGNYDSTTAHDYKHCGCKADSPRAEELSHLSYEWTREHVSAETKRFLGELPFSVDVRPRGGHTSRPQLVLVHGTPTLNTLYWTEDRPDSFCTKMAKAAGLKQGDLIAFGHTHKPWHREVEGIHFVNTGSVGKPKDGDPQACYVLIEAGEDGFSVKFVRVEYRLDRAMEGIRETHILHLCSDLKRARNMCLYERHENHNPRSQASLWPARTHAKSLPTILAYGHARALSLYPEPRAA